MGSSHICVLGGPWPKGSQVGQSHQDTGQGGSVMEVEARWQEAGAHEECRGQGEGVMDNLRAGLLRADRYSRSPPGPTSACRANPGEEDE